MKHKQHYFRILPTLFLNASCGTGKSFLYKFVISQNKKWEKDCYRVASSGLIHCLMVGTQLILLPSCLSSWTTQKHLYAQIKINQYGPGTQINSNNNLRLVYNDPQRRYRTSGQDTPRYRELRTTNGRNGNSSDWRLKANLTRDTSRNMRWLSENVPIVILLMAKN